MVLLGQPGRKSPTSLGPNDMKGDRTNSFKSSHSRVRHSFWPHVLGYVDVSPVPGPPGKSMSYLMLCANSANQHK